MEAVYGSSLLGGPSAAARQDSVLVRRPCAVLACTSWRTRGGRGIAVTVRSPPASSACAPLGGYPFLHLGGCCHHVKRGVGGSGIPGLLPPDRLAAELAELRVGRLWRGLGPRQFRERAVGGDSAGRVGEGSARGLTAQLVATSARWNTSAATSSVSRSRNTAPTVGRARPGRGRTSRRTAARRPRRTNAGRRDNASPRKPCGTGVVECREVRASRPVPVARRGRRRHVDGTEINWHTWICLLTCGNTGAPAGFEPATPALGEPCSIP